MSDEQERHRCYLAGPMRGYDDYNFPAFHAAAATLREWGWEVFSPAERDESDPEIQGDMERHDGDFSQGTRPLKYFMQYDLAAVCRSDAVFVLEGWEKSQGSRLEVQVALECGIEVLTYPDGEEVTQLPPKGEAEGVMLDFASGAVRNRKEDEIRYEGFLSPLAIRMFGLYMHRHRFTADGNVREPDNWQKGIPLDSYMDSLWRHLEDLWLIHRGYGVLARENLEDALAGLFFNVQGYMHETAKTRLEDAA